MTTSMEVKPSQGTSITSPPGNGVKTTRNRTLGSKYCHQCRQKTRKTTTTCQNHLRRKPCMIKLCSKCLWNRYGEKLEKVAGCIEWVCPKCRGICNCSVCMKRKGHQPTGKFKNAAKATGFGSISEMPDTGINASLEKELVSNPRKRREEKPPEGNLGAHLPKSAVKKTKKVKGLLDNKAVDSTTSNICNKDPDRIELNQGMEKGTDLSNVAGDDIPSEDVRDALEFLEFCSIFGKAKDF